MKVRRGFVSNSSSSSFIIAVPKGMELTAENLHRELWGTDEDLTFGPEYRSTHPVSSHDIVESMLRQIIDNQETSGRAASNINDRLHEVIEPDCDWDLIDRFEVGKKINWKAYNAEIARLTEIAVAKFLKTHPDQDFYEVSFSDNDGAFGCEVEHGEALNRRAKNVTRFSHH